MARRNQYGGYGNQQYGPAPAQNYLPAKKRSGAKKVLGKNGVDCITAWNASKRHGLMKMIASPRKTGTTECVNRHGVVLTVMVCKIQPERGQAYLVTGFWNRDEQKLRIPDLNMVASVRTNYFGGMKVKK